MTVELVTGTGGSAHVGSDDFGDYQAKTYGAGCYVLDGCEAEVVDSNTIRISEGSLLVEGRHIRVKGSEDITIQSGAVGRNRIDLIAVRYTRDSNGIEDSPLAAVVGTPVEGTPSDPPLIGGSILAGDAAADYPLYRVPITGLAVGTPALLMGRSGPFFGHGHSAADIVSGVLPVARGGTGVSSDKALALKSWPVGSVYMSFASTSPASLFGGTWAAIKGRFLYANAGTETGGSNTHTLIIAQAPSHGHTLKFLTAEYTGGGQNTYRWTSDGNGSWDPETNKVGGDQPHNNMPAYQSVYAWRRTA